MSATKASIAFGPETVKRGGSHARPISFKVVLEDGLVVTVHASDAEADRLATELKEHVR